MCDLTTDRVEREMVYEHGGGGWKVGGLIVFTNIGNGLHRKQDWTGNRLPDYAVMCTPQWKKFSIHLFVALILLCLVMYYLANLRIM